MKHVFLTDRKYKWGALFLMIIIGAFYWTSWIYDNYMFANIFTGVILAVGIVYYIKLKR